MLTKLTTYAQVEGQFSNVFQNASPLKMQIKVAPSKSLVIGTNWKRCPHHMFRVRPSQQDKAVVPASSFFFCCFELPSCIGHRSASIVRPPADIGLESKSSFGWPIHIPVSATYDQHDMFIVE